MATEAILLREIIGASPHTVDDIYERIVDSIDDAPIVLFGEATHGTHEFYALRAELTKRLILEKDFTIVAVEADWPDAYRVNRYVRGLGTDRSAYEALSDFQRFPTWMWRNEDVRRFVTWLRAFNLKRLDADKVGFYGLDLYSLSASVEAVLKYLDKVDPAAAKQARDRYSCFEMYLEEPQSYGYAAMLGLTADCEHDAIKQLIDLRKNALAYLQRDGLVDQDEQFSAEQNAIVVKNAEAYYRAMFGDEINTWNLRDTHMFETIKAIVDYFSKSRDEAKIIIWEHNSHIGDARATETGSKKELNVGQLVREHYGERARLIGFTTYTGTVTAASDWGGNSETKGVRPGFPGSYEEVFHQVGVPQFAISFRGVSRVAKILDERRLERAIGVIYRPDTERYSHYFLADISSQFDAVIHIDSTSAVKPLTEELPVKEEMPETFPTGF